MNELTAHQNYPLAPHRALITYDSLSEKSKKLLHEKDGSRAKHYKSVKLISSFATRHDYVTHYQNLALYLNMGLELVSVSRIIQFRQERFAADFTQYVFRNFLQYLVRYSLHLKIFFSDGRFEIKM